MKPISLRLAVLYTIVSVAYILISDAILAEIHVMLSPENVLFISVTKGALFVVVSSLLLGFVISRSQKSLAESEQRTDVV